MTDKRKSSDKSTKRSEPSYREIFSDKGRFAEEVVEKDPKAAFSNKEDTVFEDDKPTDRPAGNSSNANLKKQSGTIWIRIMAIFGAVLIWIYAAITDTTLTQKIFENIPITNKNADELIDNHNISLISDTSTIVDVTVEGKNSSVNKLENEDISVTVDYSGIAEAGEYTLKVSATAPGGVNVVSCRPSTITVYVDEEISVSKPVKTSPQYVTGNVDYIVDEVIETPNIMVTGPKKLVDSVECATLNIDLGTLDSSRDAVAKVALTDKFGNAVESTYLRTNVSEIPVHYYVSMYKTVRLETALKNGSLGSDRVKVELSENEMRVKGRIEDLQGFDNLVIYSVDEELLFGDKLTGVVRPELPSGIENADDFSEITVTATVSDSKMRRISTAISKDNLADFGITVIPPEKGYDYSLDDSMLSIALRAPDNLLYERTIPEIFSDLGLTIDLSGYNTEQTAEIPVEMNINTGSNYFAVYPTDAKEANKITVKIIKSESTDK